jgi:hypothetical protein
MAEVADPVVVPEAIELIEENERAPVEAVEAPAEAVEATEAKAEPEVKVEAKPEPEPHARETLITAQQLGIPADDIAEMTPKELKRTISHMTRGMQETWDKLQVKAEPKVEEKPDPQVEWLKGLEDLLPEVKAPIAHLLDEVKTLRGLRDEIADLKQVKLRVERDDIRRQLEPAIKEINPDLVKEFSTDEGWRELMGAMATVVDFEGRTGQKLTEPDRVKRAVAMLGKAATAKNDAEEKLKAEFEAYKAQFNQASLGKPEGRKESSSLIGLVNEKVKKMNANAGGEVIDTPFVPYEG